MSTLTHVPVSPLPPERFREVLGSEFERVEEAIETAASLLADRAVWHVNSTSAGGGVAELLHSLLAYARGAGVDVRWVVIGGDPEFFRITKRIHNHLHGLDADDGELGAGDLKGFLAIEEARAAELAELVRAGDVIYLHDPQTAGMVERLRATGATVIWRCHIGIDEPNAIMRSAWDALRPLVAGADRYVFSRREYAWEGLDPDRVSVIEPSIDAFSPKNELLGDDVVRSIIDRIGLCSDGGAPALYRRQDGSRARVDRRAIIDQDIELPDGVPILTQVSRWDQLKDPIGVLEGFARHVATRDAHLLLVGPAVDGVTDDPEGAQVLAAVRAARNELAAERRARTHLVSLPMDDMDENAAMVNAIQRYSTVIAQKSIAEGFGLTATEAMWKARPVIASAVGGLGEQVVDGVTGRLIADPHDLVAFGRAADELFADPELAKRLGEAGQERVRDRYLGTRHLIEYVELLSRMLS